MKAAHEMKIGNRQSQQPNGSRRFPEKNKMFERGALTLVGSFVVALVSAALIDPPNSGAEVSLVSARNVEHLNLPVGKSPQILFDEDGLDGDELEGFTVAAGPATGPINIAFKVSNGMAKAKSANALSSAFEQMNYNLDEVMTGDGEVPRVFLAHLPGDLAKVAENQKRKSIFFQSMLPLILQVNEEILQDRKRLWELHYKQRLGYRIGATDRLWLEVMAERYKVKSENIEALISRVDVIPPSMALAQAAEESGWGTSRFAREGNAMFGQWTYAKTGGLKPSRRDEGKTHSVRAFENLIDSVRAYTRNLNTHRAYKRFRGTRAQIRRVGGPLDGRVLVGQLDKYSERGQDYVKSLRKMIDGNRLRRLDDARLSDDRPAISKGSLI